MDEAFRIYGRAARLDGLGVGVELENVLARNAARGERTRHEEMPRHARMADAHMAEAVEHALVIENVVGDDEIVD